LQWKSFLPCRNFAGEKKDWNVKRDPFARNVPWRKGYAQKIRRNKKRGRNTLFKNKMAEAKNKREFVLPHPKEAFTSAAANILL
jgi:hypothetical protein